MKRCQNAQPGTYGHECGQPAQWTATNSQGHTAGFCDQCKQHGHEARTYSQWNPYKEPQQ